MNNAASRGFQIGDEVRIIGSDPIYDDCDVGWVIWNVSEKVKTMYVMRNDGSAGEEAKAEWYKTGRHNTALAEAIKALPSVTLQQKTGHWEWVQYDSNRNLGNWHCSECNRIVCGAITAVNPVYEYKYCPNCGAKM